MSDKNVRMSNDAQPSLRHRLRSGLTSASVESRAIWIAAIALAISWVIAFFWMVGTRHPLAGPDSVGNRAAIIGGLLAAAAFGIAYAFDHRESSEWRRGMPMFKRILDGGALAVAHGGVAYLACVLAAETFQRGFVGLDVDALAGACLVSIATAASVYLASLSGYAVTSSSLSVLVTSTIVVGTLISMLTASNENWWHEHFSALGNQEGRSAYAFNGTLVLSGLIITTLANYVSRDMERGLRQRGITPHRVMPAMPWVFAGIGIGLMIVGLVPDNVNKAVHIAGAVGMVLLFVTFAIMLMTVVPGLGPVFHTMSLFVFGGIVFAALLWVPFGYYALTGLEFAAAGLIFTWLLLFVRNIAAFADDGDAATGGAESADSVAVTAGGAPRHNGARNATAK